MNDTIYTVSTYLKDHFKCKTVKLAIDGGFTCPNRDGSKSSKGCIFCSEDGSGEFASDIETQIKLLSSKWPSAKYLAYFQNHTNTYAPVSVLREKFYEALNHPKISGIVIATRPDCISDEVLELLDEINKKHFMWIEFGLQTIHQETAEFINRCYDLSVYDSAMKKMHEKNIKVVTHLILGLPGETKEMMFQSVKYVCNSDTWGLKLHLLNVVKGSPLALTHSSYEPFSSIEEYVNLVCDLIEIIPQEVVMHRLTADAPRKILISPEWSYKKRTILNGINKELKERCSYQGCKK